MQVIGCVIGAKISAVAKDRTILHQTVTQENLLPASDIASGKESRAIRPNDFGWDWRLPGIGPVSQQPHNEEATTRQRLTLETKPWKPITRALRLPSAASSDLHSKLGDFHRQYDSGFCFQTHPENPTTGHCENEEQTCGARGRYVQLLKTGSMAFLVIFPPPGPVSARGSARKGMCQKCLPQMP